MFILFIHVFQVLAGYQDLNNNMWLNWTFPNTQSIALQVGVSASIYNQNGWVGIGVKSADGAGDMSNADIVSFYMGSINNCQDRFSVDASGLPPVDTVKNVNCLNRVLYNGYYVYQWTRNLNTEDQSDLVLSQGERVIVIWAYGLLSGGDLGYHGSSQDTHGHIIVFLQENFRNGVINAGFVLISLFGIRFLL